MEIKKVSIKKQIGVFALCLACAVVLGVFVSSGQDTPPPLEGQNFTEILEELETSPRGRISVIDGEVVFQKEGFFRYDGIDKHGVEVYQETRREGSYALRIRPGQYATIIYESLPTRAEEQSHAGQRLHEQYITADESE